MPRNQGTSRKGKPKKHERAAGMGRSLQKSRIKRHTPSASTGGMAMRQGVESINTSTKNDFVDARASVLDVNDLDDFLIQAEMANREFASEKEQVVVLDSTAQAASDMYILDNGGGVGTTTLQGRGPASSHFAFQELSVPRRPAWDETTTADELHRKEKESFLDWRRGIAEKEEEMLFKSNSGSISSLGVTPFEKNIEIWRQLWRVLERCSCIVQIVDARNPLFYLSKDLKTYTTQELGKPMLLLINKSDYLSPAQRQAWHQYFSDPDHLWEHVFFSAHDEQHRLDEEATLVAKEEELREEREYQAQVEASLMDDDDAFQEEDGDRDTELDETSTQNPKPPHPDYTNVGVKKPLSRTELLGWLYRFAEDNNCSMDPKYDRVPFGMVGFPNVGKSSVINVLMGHAKNSHGVVRVGVASQPGKTKHFQTLLLPDREDVLLCDCPGLVFPSFVNNTADLIAAGVFPIAQMRDWKPVMELLCRRIPREVLNAQYGIQIPMPTADAMMHASRNEEMGLPAPTADEFLSCFCEARNMYAASSGVPDFQRASRIIIKEYADGKLLFCHSPPKFDETFFQKETLRMALQKTKKLRDRLPHLKDGECTLSNSLHDKSPQPQTESLSLERSDSLTSGASSQNDTDGEFESTLSVSDERTKIGVHSLYDCRKEASRLLGLIGAPPLEWKSFEMKTAAPSSKYEGAFRKDTASRSFIEFLEAHVKFLLTVDQAYYWMKVSASLHMGLGPNSQCVERVERAAIAKDRRQSERTETMDEKQQRLEPQRRLDASSVPPLASARRNLAQSLVDQSQSLIQAFQQVQTLNQGHANAAVQDEHDELVALVEEHALRMPEIVDLSWIKTSRNDLASFLSCIMDELCTVEWLQLVCSDETGRDVLVQSMLNAQNAEEHLRSNLLLDDSSASSPLTQDKLQVAPSDLVMSLLQYREQLEAIGAALWSCQQYSAGRADGGSASTQEDASLSKLAWWDRVKQLSANCKALEKEIEEKIMGDDRIDPSVVRPESEVPVDSKSRPIPESGHYEHTSANETSKKLKSTTPPFKTMVFAGSGSAAKKANAMSASSNDEKNASSVGTTLPERDTVIEYLLVRELRNRIELMGAREEEEVPITDAVVEDGGDRKDDHDLTTDVVAKEQDVLGNGAGSGR